MIARQVTTRDAGIALLISSLLLGTVAARADHHVPPSPNQPAQSAAQADDEEPTEVGAAESNVDKDSSSGSYYPYSAGTVGDDPSEPTSTSVPADAGDSDSGPTDQWSDAADTDGDGYLSPAELTESAPALSASFEAMDVDGDGKLTRGEFRTWHESRKARVNADNQASLPKDDGTPRSVAPPDDGGH